MRHPSESDLRLLYAQRKDELIANMKRDEVGTIASPEDSPAMIDLKANMKKDEIGEIALNDPLIKKYMAILLDRRYEKMEGVQCCRQQGRNLARILHHAR